MAMLVVKLKPSASKDSVDGWIEDTHGRPCLSVKVSAPPVEGKANKALVKMLAAHLFVAPSTIRIIGGETAKTKRVEISGLDEEALYRALGFKRELTHSGG